MAHKLIYIITCISLILLMLSSCESSVSRKKTNDIWEGGYIEIITVDSCLYVYFPKGDRSWGSHKGNCTNPVHTKGRDIIHDTILVLKAN